MSPNEQVHEPLLATSTESQWDPEKPRYNETFPWLSKRMTLPLWLFILLPVFEIAFFTSWAMESFVSGGENDCGYRNSQLLYSPAEEAVEYVPTRFQSNFFGDTNDPPGIFVEDPSPKVDAAWRNLYDFGISQITAIQASQLSNSTLPNPSDPSGFLIGIDVFHQLHCLNMIRKALFPMHYPPDPRENEEERRGHLAHCVNSLRQSLECNADISTIVWRKNGAKISPRFDIVHSCRNFDRIRDWGQRHHTAIHKQGGGEITAL